MRTAYLVAHFRVGDTTSTRPQTPEFGDVRIYSEFPVTCEIRRDVQCLLTSVSAETFQEAIDILLDCLSGPYTPFAWTVPYLDRSEQRRIEDFKLKQANAELRQVANDNLRNVAEVDENDIVTIYDENGQPRMWLPLADYRTLRDEKEEV